MKQDFPEETSYLTSWEIALQGAGIRTSDEKLGIQGVRKWPFRSLPAVPARTDEWAGLNRPERAGERRRNKDIPVFLSSDGTVG